MIAALIHRPKRVVALLLILFFGLCLLDHRIVWDWIYTHWLYDYHFGFMKRGLIGETLSIALGRPQVVSLSVVKIISWIIFLVNVGLFLYFFRDLYRNIEINLHSKFFVFFSFCLLAPVSLRNFAYDLGRFDQLSCIFLFLQWFSPPTWAVVMGGVIATLIHENFIFMFLPAVLLLHSFQRGFKPALVVAGAALLTTALVVKFGAAGTDIDTLWAYLTSKADAPLDHNVNLLYWKLLDQLAINWMIFKSHILYLPGYVFYALFCIPIYRGFRKIKLESKQKLFSVGMACGYLAILFLSDWCRSIGNFFVVTVFLCIYFLRDKDVQRNFFNTASFRNQKIILTFLAFSILPAAGVDVPRIYKLIEIIGKKSGLF